MAAPVVAMVRRGAVIGLAGIGLSACCLLPASQQANACPEVTRASAWVNQMPGPRKSSANFHIALRLDDDQPWMLSPRESGEAGIMALDMKPGGPAVPGTAGYRQDIPSPFPDEIRIRCGGEVVSVIDEITVAR